jgi:hypothetical protein
MAATAATRVIGVRSIGNLPFSGAIGPDGPIALVRSYRSGAGVHEHPAAKAFWKARKSKMVSAPS